MDESRELIDGLVNRWILSLPNALEAYRRDPQFHYQVEWIRTMMITLNGLMEQEGIISRTRLKIFKKLVLAGPDANAALRRLQERDKQLRELMNRASTPAPWQLS